MRIKPAFHLRRSPQRDVDEEIEFHFASRIADLVRSGMTAADAKLLTEHEFGDTRWVRAELLSSTRRRAARRSRSDAVRDLAGDASYVIRSARRAPGGWLAIALTLGLGIGASATMYGVVDQLLIRGPELVHDPASLRRVYAHVRTKASGEFTTSTLGYAAYSVLREQTRSVAGAAAYAVDEARVGRGLDATTVRRGTATADFFPLLSVRPSRGRFFTPAEASPPEGNHVVVLSHEYWTRAFGGSDSALGRMVSINDRPFAIIGVAPPGFTGAELRPVDLWIPMTAGQHPTPDWPITWRAQWLNVLVRMKPNVSSQRLDEDLTSTFRAAYAGPNEEWKTADLSGRNILFTANGTERPEASIARWLSAVALLVLLIASANAASLLIVRAMRRHHEIAVRLALGISRLRLARLLVLEGFLCSAGGAATGIGVAYAGGETMRRVLLPAIAWATPPVSGETLFVACGLALIIGVSIGLAPIAQVLSADLAASLRAGVNWGARATTLRRTLLLTQTALSVTLLVGAGLFIRSLANVQRIDLGVEPARVLVANVQWPTAPNATIATIIADLTRRGNTWRELREIIARTPGVRDAALAVGSPFGNGFGVDLRVPGHDSLPSAPGGGPYISAVGVGYFATVGTPIMRGRAFAASDGEHSERIAIVNQTMASLVWPNEEPLGKCLIVDDKPCSTVVGVAHDSRRFALREPPAMQYYVPFGQESGIAGTALLVRPTGDARAFEETLRRTIGAEERDAHDILVSPMQDRVDPQIRPWRLGATMFGSFAAVALVVAAIGLYSAIAYSTEQRKHEFGVRLAVGAGTWRLVCGVLFDGMRTAVSGLLLGAIVALVAGGRIAPLLFDVSPRDPVVFLSVMMVLVTVAVLASIVPAWKAGHTDPLAVLRST
jgi:predicted permease